MLIFSRIMVRSYFTPKLPHALKMILQEKVVYLTCMNSLFRSHYMKCSTQTPFISKQQRLFVKILNPDTAIFIFHIISLC